MHPRPLGPPWLSRLALLVALVAGDTRVAHAEPGPVPERGAGRAGDEDGPSAGDADPAGGEEAPARATGPEGRPEVIELHGQAPARDAVHPDAARALDEAAFVTVVRVDEHAGEITTLAELASESVGVRTRSAGGLGSFSSISVRGAEAGHTTVLVDGVPLSRLASVGVDLGRFDLGSVSEIELYRGAVPVGFGSAALGGALNLVTRTGPPQDGPALAVSAGVGSFGARHARARWLGGARDGRRGYHLSASYAGAQGDFTYFDDRGTGVNPDDDTRARRRNNHYDQLDAVARVKGRRGGLGYHAGVRSTWKRQGVPGSASAQSERSDLSSMTHIADLGARASELLGQPRLDGRASLYGVLEWQRYRDLDGEIGIGVQDRRYLGASLGANALVRRGFGLAHRAELGLDGRVDVYEDRDLRAAAGEAPETRGHRTALAATLDHTWTPVEGVLVRPAVRLDWLHTAPILDRLRPDAPPGPARDDLVASPRLAARVRLVEGLVVKGSAGRYMRAPTLLELYGDRGFTVGNPALRTETGTAGDLGVVFAPLAALAVFDRVYAEAALFARHTRDTIAFVSAGGPAAGAQNLGDSRTYGAEAGAAVRVAGVVTARGNYTYLVARRRSPLVSYDGKPLPQRPRHQIYGRVDVEGHVAGRALAAWTDASFTTASFLDAAGLAPIPARTLIGAGVRGAVIDDLVLAFEVKNLADARVERVPLDPPPQPDLTSAPRAIADLAGYPLPGRALYLTLTWRR